MSELDWDIEDERIENLGPEVAWRYAIRAYEADDLNVAHSLAARFGGAWGGSLLGYYRQIEAEWTTRQANQSRDLGDGVSLEWPSDISPRIADGERIVRIVRDVSDRFRWQRQRRVRVAWLSPNVDAPWFGLRAGYYMNKTPFHKICVPGGLQSNETEMEAALAHEVAHAMIQERTLGNAPIWLHEAVAQVAEHRNINGVARTFRSDPTLWLDPEELSQAFGTDRRDAANFPGIGRAYAQAAYIGRWLAETHGEPALGQVLDAFSDNSFVENLRMRVTGQTAADEALRQVLKMGEREIFEACEP
ncbi:MAG: hypothetical protein KF812_06710 [Fimbriimonadaceae bacterium]|nr:hypothetical protein [Fimbriimonadaceae bacterium]